MTIEALLRRLENVKETGHGTWLARCPAHDDHHPSLSIGENDSGIIVLHCFAGCSTHDVLVAVDLDWTALFPKPLGNHKAQRRPFATADVLRAVAFEALVVAVAAGNIANGITLSDEDRARLIVASGRLQAAVEAAGL